LELFVLRLAFMLLLPPELVLRFMFPFMLLVFEFVEFEFDMFEFMFDVFDEFVVDVFDVFVVDVFVVDVFELLAFPVLVLLVLSPPPQAERLATPANARSAKVLRMDRSPELL
jgi:hypothetical protein